MIATYLYKRLKLLYFNRKNGTNIRSVRASLRASYGKSVSVGSGTIVTDDVSMGNFSYVNINSSIEKCHIGNYCSISSGVWICPAEHHLDAGTTHPIISSLMPEKRKTVVIGNDVLISINAVILSGVKIGDGAVVGAGAVVTKDVEPYEIVGGIPARHIGWRLPSEVRQKLQQSRWWERDYQDIIEDPEMMNLLNKNYKNE